LQDRRRPQRLKAGVGQVHTARLKPCPPELQEICKAVGITRLRDGCPPQKAAATKARPRTHTQKRRVRHPGGSETKTVAGMKAGATWKKTSGLVGGVAWAADRVNLGQAIFYRRQLGKRGVWFRLIPIGDGKIIVGANIGVAVFDGGLQRFRERNRRIQVEAVDRTAAAGALLPDDGGAVERIRKPLAAEIVSAEKVIF
jgi:hypothetical protein